MSLDLTGIGAVADLANNLVSRFFPDKSEAERAQISLMLATITGQMDTNKIEAANPNVFVSGWRPFVGWVCGAACAWNWIGLPVAKACAALIGHPLVIEPADLSQMFPLLMGLLGMGALRTYEKINGVAAK